MEQEKKLIYRAGLIPYIVEDNNNIKMMFMVPSDPDFGGPLPQISKGKVEGEETNEQAAIREAQEELGLFKGNIITINEVGNFMGRTMVYVAKIKNHSLFGEPSFETEKTMWMTLNEFIENGRELHKPVVKAAYRKIQQIENINE